MLSNQSTFQCHRSVGHLYAYSDCKYSSPTVHHSSHDWSKPSIINAIMYFINTWLWFIFVSLLLKKQKSRATVLKGAANTPKDFSYCGTASESQLCNQTLHTKLRKTFCHHFYSQSGAAVLKSSVQRLWVSYRHCVENFIQ